MQIDVTFLEA